MNYKSFNLGDWIGHISGVIEDETTLDGNEMRDLVEFLSRLPRWIPISERLPQENERMLVTIQTPHRTSVRSGVFFYPWFSIDNGDCWRFNEEEVVAWMPLPNAYKEVDV